MKWLWLAVGVVFLLTNCAHHAMRAAGRRMIVLGIDGMDPVFLEQHWNALPNLDRLRKKGSYRHLATTVPPQSPVAWSTVATGLDPGGHGIFDFVHRDPVTRLPISSVAQVREPAHNLHIGPYLIPLSPAGVTGFRTGRTFWQLMGDHGIPATVIRIPANFPPAECEQESLAGMGTPDLGGSFGNFTFFTDDPLEPQGDISGGHIVPVRQENGTAILHIEGPPNSLRRDHAKLSTSIIVHIDPVEPVARFDRPDDQFILREGEWSDWQQAGFEPIPFFKSITGIFRLYLQQVHPHLRIYVSPINLDPRDPALPLSTPAGLSRALAERLGPFYTQGIAEETSAFRAGIFSKDEFLLQSHKVLDDNLRMFRYELEHFTSGLLFYYFSSIDQNSHMLWGRYDRDLLDIYRKIDDAIGEAMRQSNTELIILSDHGFAPFIRAVHLNSWLVSEGFMSLDETGSPSEEEGFPHTRWEKTEAYALGLNGIYLNLSGRESGGVVPLGDKQRVLDEIARKLLAFRDPATGVNVVDKVYFTEKIYRGRNLRYAPDLIVGFRRGYRVSWQSALGGVPKTLIEDNTQAWIGDHCVAAEEVPGVLLSNRKIRPDQPQMYDVPATILSEFGVPRSAGMLGESVF